MKALSVKQPWATLIVEGEKTIEVRGWKTDHRGPLLICASAAPNNVFWHDDVENTHRLMHAGCIIGAVNLIDCRPMVEDDDLASYGQYKPGAIAWVVEPVHFCKPVPVAGRLNLFDVPDSLIEPIGNDPETEWIFSYPPPQGAIKYTKKCPTLG